MTASGSELLCPPMIAFEEWAAVGITGLVMLVLGVVLFVIALTYPR